MATHLLLTDFLDPAERNHVLDWAHRVEPFLQMGTIQATGAARHATNPDFRSCKLTFGTDEIQFHFESRLRTLLPYACERLDIVPFPPAKIEYQFTLHEDGDLFGPHIDNGESAESRVISWVYYLNERYVPSRGLSNRTDGGHLILYPSGSTTDPVDDPIPGFEMIATRPASDLVRLPPIDGSLVLFRSNILHEVTRVDALNGDAKRWTVNGWIHV